MVVITKKKGETKDSLFRKFTRAFIDEEIVEKLRDIQYYKKPSRRKLEKHKNRSTRGRIGANSRSSRMASRARAAAGGRSSNSTRK